MSPNPATPSVTAANAMVRVDSSPPPSFSDDSLLGPLVEAVRGSLAFYRTLPPERLFYFGPDAIAVSELAESLEYFLKLVESGKPGWAEAIRRDFQLYASVGSDRDGTVVYSAYYEHEVSVSLSRTGRFRFPLYGRPGDLEEILGPHGERQGIRRAGSGGRPYFTRKEIDSGGALSGRGLEIAWADDPVSVFFLQVQGSGWLRLANGERLRVRYAGHNGHPYRSVGGYMIESGILPREKFSRKAMVDYLSHHPEERQEILNRNPRYVFFKIDRGPSREQVFGSLNLALTPGRSVAMDPSIFPPGALAWMETDEDPKVGRFVLNQDEGGAIKGPARVDFFVGGGPEAESYAVRFWEKGRLYFLVRKRGETSRGGRRGK